jgi:thioredoxin-like negative regulator of GroEL
VIDCSTFQSSEIDALYSEGDDARELDAEGSAAMAEHASTCAACSARLERLRATRGRILSVAIEPVPQDFESRIMAAVDAGLATRAAAPAKAESGGAKILRFMARPSFAVAATFVLVLGGAAFMMTRSASMKSMARSDDAPAAAEASPAPAASMARAASDEGDPSANGFAAATTTATASPPAAVVAAAPAAGAPVAMASKASAKPSAPSADDRAFTAAKALVTAGRCPEALPKLQALAPNNPEADLYVARCIAKTRGCAAAAPSFDHAAQTNAGTESGSRAQIEGAKCYQSTGDLVAARKRLEAAKDEGTLSAEATQGLDALDADAKPGAGTPSTGARAAPKARPAPAAEPPAKR